MPRLAFRYERPVGRARRSLRARLLAEHGLTVSVRKSRGRDIRAACGQLIVEGQKKATGRRLADAVSTYGD